MFRRLSIFCCLLLLFTADASAQWEMLQKVDSFLVRMQRSNVDTNYIVRPKGRLTVRLLSNFSGAHVDLIDRERGEESVSANLRSDMKWTLTSSINYRGLSVALSVNPGHVFDWYHDMEFNINAYGNKMGADFIYQHAENVGGEMGDSDLTLQIPENMISMRTVNANYYYVFNHRRFSYPAAFTQSFIQKRSAGSVIVGASYEKMVMKLGKDFDFLTDGDTNLMNTDLLGIGVGYGYNIVPNPKWLIHLSGLPTVVVWRNMHMEDDGYTARGSHPFSLPNLLVTARLSIIHYHENRFYGITGVLNHSHLGQSGADMTDHLKWRIRLLFGIRFW
ncbi:MAG: DUF4421 family protein [Bacteroidaceae bacterium]|nr:DUF4421 family protein [Bacteroidaceae bacterium]